MSSAITTESTIAWSVLCQSAWLLDGEVQLVEARPRPLELQAQLEQHEEEEGEGQHRQPERGPHPRVERRHHVVLGWMVRQMLTEM